MRTPPRGGVQDDQQTPGVELASAGLGDNAPQPKRSCAPRQQPLWVADDVQSVSSLGSDLTGGAVQQGGVQQATMAAASVAGQQLVLQQPGVPQQQDFQANLACAAAVQIQQNLQQNMALQQAFGNQVFRAPGSIPLGPIPGQVFQQQMVGQPAELDIQYLPPRNGGVPQRSNRAMGPYGR